MRQLCHGMIFAVLLAAAGCGEAEVLPILPEGIGPHPVGTWVLDCWNDGGAYISETITFDGSGGILYAGATFSDPACTLQTGTDGWVGTSVIGTALYGKLGGTTVVAWQVDVTPTLPASPSMYTIFHVDQAATPDNLYIGDDGPPNNGSTPALRPTELQADKPRYLGAT